MVEGGNKQGELKDSRKRGCFGPEKFHAGQSSSGQSSANSGGAAGDSGTRGHRRSTGELSAAGGEKGKTAPVSGCLFS